MKFSCARNDLAESMLIVQNAVMIRSTTPFLEGILVEAGDTLKLTAFNLEIGITCTVNADIMEKGALVLNARLFGDIVRALPNAEVLITAGKNNELEIDAEGSRFDIRGIPADGYPQLPEVQDGIVFDLPQKILKDMIRKTSFAVGTEQYRVILTGSLIELSDNEVNVVAIDGFRVAWRKERHEAGKGDMKVVIPGKSLNELAKILTSGDEVIRAVMSKKHIVFYTEKYKFLSRVLEGEYLAYRSLIPTSFSTTVRVSPARLLESVERACLVIGDEKHMQVSLSIQTDKITLTTNSDSGNYLDLLTMSQEGDDLDIIFNPKYLLEALKATQDEEFIRICFNSSVHPCVIRPDEGDGFTYMILPMRV